MPFPVAAGRANALTVRIDFGVRQVMEWLRCQVWEMSSVELREEMGSRRESWPVQGEVMESFTETALPALVSFATAGIS